MVPNYFHSVVLDSGRCIGCTYCIKGCPTEAIRLKNNKASIIAERCIDCGECIRICPNHAKNAVTDNISIVNKYKYTAAIVSPVLYSQFSREISPFKVLSAIKSLGFDEACDTSTGSEIIDAILESIVSKYKYKPAINSSCPAIMRLIQVRFPELINNVLDIATPVEITARLVKDSIIKKTGLSGDEIGIILISPCTARATAIKRPLGINYSYIDGAVSVKDLIGPIIRALHSAKEDFSFDFKPTRDGVLWNAAGGQSSAFKDGNTLEVDGINNAISVLEEIELGKLTGVPFIEITACPGGCVGGPLMVENRYVALNILKNISKNTQRYIPSKNETSGYLTMYDSGAIRFTEKMEPQTPIALDIDISKSIEKMDRIRKIAGELPGINCGICGSPTCQAFAEDIVRGDLSNRVCPVIIMEKIKKDNAEKRDYYARKRYNG